MKFKELELLVLINGQPVEEYQTTREENIVTCWIASEAGEEFAIQRKLGAASDQIFSCWSRVDGRFMHRGIVKPGAQAIVYGANVSADSIRPFEFSPLDLTDEDQALEQSHKNLESLGTIMVETFRVTVGRTSKWRNDTKRDLSEIGPVHERSKKAGVHCVSLGEAKKAAPITQVHVHYPYGNDKPDSTFIFRYRPKELLQAQGIIPLPVASSPPRAEAAPASVGKKRANARELDDSAAGSSKRPRANSPEVKPESDESDDDDDDEARAKLQAQLEDIQAKLSTLKKKDGKRVKREPSPIRMDTSGDVIDLTSD